MQQLNEFRLHGSSTYRLQLMCLGGVGFFTFLSIVLGILAADPLKNHIMIWICILSAFYLGVTVMQPIPHSARGLILTGVCFCGWILWLQFSDYWNFAETAYYGARFMKSAFLCEFLMLLPCGLLLNEGENYTGLKIFSSFYVLAGGVFCVYLGMVYLEIVPYYLSQCMGWLGTKLSLNWYYVSTGHIFMLCLGATLGSLCITRNMGLKIILGLLCVLEFVGLALTDCRAANLMGHCLLGGTVFCLIFRPGTEKQDLRHFLLGILAFLAVAAVCYGIYRGISLINYRYLTENVLSTQMSEASLQGNGIAGGAPRGLSKDTAGLNGRLAIWQAVLLKIRENPGVLFRGVQNTAQFIGGAYGQGSAEDLVAHAHNAWLETLLRLGLPGFLIAISITWTAIKNILLILLFRGGTLFQKITAMVTLCILGVEFLECGLFYAEVPKNYANAYFLLNVGYMACWNRKQESIPGSKAAKQGPSDEI